MMTDRMQLPAEYLHIEVRYLSDITGQRVRREEPISKEVLEWLCAVFPDAHEEYYTVAPPPGSLGMLLPKTKVVLIVPRFLWGTIQSIISSIGIYELRGDALNQSLVGVGLGNALRDILSSFARLKELEGEYCTFSALIDAQKTNSGFSSKPCDTARVWQAHERHRKNCPVTNCRFHGQECRLLNRELEEILEKVGRARVG